MYAFRVDRKVIAAWASLFAVLLAVTLVTRGAVWRSPAYLLGIALAAGSVAWITAKPRPKALPEPTKTAGELPAVNMILRVAKANKGRITAAEVLADTTLTLETVTNTLDELTLAGTCQLVVGQKGTQVYYFPEFENDAAKDELVT